MLISKDVHMWVYLWMESISACVSSEPPSQSGENRFFVYVIRPVMLTCVGLSLVFTWVQVKVLHPVVLISMSGHLCMHVCAHKHLHLWSPCLPAGSVEVPQGPVL